MILLLLYIQGFIKKCATYRRVPTHLQYQWFTVPSSNLTALLPPSVHNFSTHTSRSDIPRLPKQAARIKTVHPSHIYTTGTEVHISTHCVSGSQGSLKPCQAATSTSPNSNLNTAMNKPPGHPPCLWSVWDSE